jgi:hypothetical protein
MASAPTEIRTPVLALKGLRPSPLDDGGVLTRASRILPDPSIWVKRYSGKGAGGDSSDRERECLAEATERPVCGSSNTFSQDNAR